MVAITALNGRIPTSMLVAANEIRAAWQDDRAHLPTRAEVDARLKPLETFVAANQGHDAGVASTRSNTRLTSGVMISALGALTGLMALVIALAALVTR